MSLTFSRGTKEPDVWGRKFALPCDSVPSLAPSPSSPSLAHTLPPTSTLVPGSGSVSRCSNADSSVPHTPYVAASKRTDMCSNCGMHGHVTNQCKNPITSYGAIAYRLTPDNGVEYIMICRKHSLGYMDFIRGKLPLTNRPYLMCMINQMTDRERARLRDMSAQATHPKEKIAALIAGVVSKTGERYTLAELVDGSDMYGHWTEPEWGFPKGKRNMYESDLDCALREFNEETGFPVSFPGVSAHVSVHAGVNVGVNVGTSTPLPPVRVVSPVGRTVGRSNRGPALIETFFGSNGKRYCHKYVLIEVDYAFSETLDMNGFQASEVSDMQWMSYDQCLVKIRKYNVEKIQLLTAVHAAISGSVYAT